MKDGSNRPAWRWRPEFPNDDEPYIAPRFSSLLNIMFQVMTYMQKPKIVKALAEATLLWPNSSPWGWFINRNSKEVGKTGGMPFACHVVENTKYNISTSSSLHKEATGHVSLRVRVEFHIPAYTHTTKYQFSPLHCLKESTWQNTY